MGVSSLAASACTHLSSDSQSQRLNTQQRVRSVATNGSIFIGGSLQQQLKERSD